MPQFLPARRRSAVLLVALGALAFAVGPVAAQDVARMDKVVRASSDADAFSGAVEK